MADINVVHLYVRILAGCHGVLYKQLSAWMLHGLLPENEEFFIVPTSQMKEVLQYCAYLRRSSSQYCLLQLTW